MHVTQQEIDAIADILIDYWIGKEGQGYHHPSNNEKRGASSADARMNSSQEGSAVDATSKQGSELKTKRRRKKLPPKEE